MIYLNFNLQYIIFTIFCQIEAMLKSLDLEFRRKLFHLCSAIIPVAYIFISKPLMTLVLMSLALITSALDTTRHYHKTIQVIFDKFLSQFMRDKEKNGSFVPSGTRYMAAGFFLVTLLFPKGLAIASMLVLVVADACAAIVGMKLGTPCANGKSFAGSTAFFMSAILISTLSHGIVYYNANFFTIILASLATTAVEHYASKIKVDDNLSIPLAFAISVTFLGWL
jgi:dolichol kinase